MTEALTIPAVIDVEASGFGRYSYPIEIGVITALRQSYCYLIRPEKSWNHWDSSAETIHGISRDILFAHGRSALDVARELNQRFHGETLYTDAWGHDLSWVGKLHEICGVPMRYQLESIRKLITEEQTQLWNHTKQRVMSISPLDRHRASADAWLLQETFLQLQQATRSGTSARNANAHYPI